MTNVINFQHERRRRRKLRSEMVTIIIAYIAVHHRHRSLRDIILGVKSLESRKIALFYKKAMAWHGGAAHEWGLFLAEHMIRRVAYPRRWHELEIQNWMRKLPEERR